MGLLTTCRTLTSREELHTCQHWVLLLHSVGRLNGASSHGSDPGGLPRSLLLEPWAPGTWLFCSTWRGLKQPSQKPNQTATEALIKSVQIRLAKAGPWPSPHSVGWERPLLTAVGGPAKSPGKEQGCICNPPQEGRKTGE
uniref:Uncharacterized protein n=1 Tax=Myotis myotis TaxID=51298 RepID=A0A7J7UPD7_MYOMY|nr:hypothetical protein mMyoMyo1_008556 [Myotis myotis]